MSVFEAYSNLTIFIEKMYVLGPNCKKRIQNESILKCDFQNLLHFFRGEGGGEGIFDKNRVEWTSIRINNSHIDFTEINRLIDFTKNDRLID